ncbi:hypothetical protein [Corynebacterium pseudodiphtheriticum]|uniref:Secreted protein n=1 Tax=Corynebacterium pseudodiphtheriticum TaxID=37637 RepID=A0ABT7FVK6_9CORY|nr:hypothetical protein [Corynebacterium pseudodiphtheriticum]ERJ47215.1 hypothetical protein N579_00515 [Corynebacterium pseudodiphtheriticum 090104]MDK4289945.1 hypothetical protein [Corynebacterium pseudodiphtheriticum]
MPLPRPECSFALTSAGFSAASSARASSMDSADAVAVSVKVSVEVSVTIAWSAEESTSVHDAKRMHVVESVAKSVLRREFTCGDIS